MVMSWILFILCQYSTDNSFGLRTYCRKEIWLESYALKRKKSFMINLLIEIQIVSFQLLSKSISWPRSLSFLAKPNLLKQTYWFLLKSSFVSSYCYLKLFDFLFIFNFFTYYSSKVANFYWRNLTSPKILYFISQPPKLHFHVTEDQ